MVYSYTDNHNVDEDMATIIDYGGHWAYNDAVGITIRHMHDPTDCTYPWVASRLIYLS